MTTQPTPPAAKPPRKIVHVDAAHDERIAQLVARYHDLKPIAAEFDQLKKDIKSVLHSAAADPQATHIPVDNVAEPLTLRYTTRTEFNVKQWRLDHPGDTAYDRPSGRWELRNE